MWKICIAEPFLNCEKVFPTKQKYVKQIVDSLCDDANVRRIVVFGSSVTYACNPWSDLDLYLELEEERHYSFFGMATDVDLWTNFSADAHLKNEILKKGVIVYERDDLL